ACTIDPSSELLHFAGIGNIAARALVGSTQRSLLSREGTIGTHLAAPHPRSEHVAWAPGSTLVLASDGLRPGFDLRSYGILLGRDPVLVAAVLQRDHGRGHDDATVLVVQDVRRAAT
ncbi:MAG TPA: hypothetical protein VMD59_13725, partial [Acidimicrobiales bacterium]|nr:hypothetical protein [Acidimicrobiales bacterium]